MMTLHKLTVGDGYTYLTRHVAGGDCDRQPGQEATDYYTAHGNPPGRWGGRGLSELGLSGTVSEVQMRYLFGQGMHPDADRIIAEHLRAHTMPGVTEEQLEELSFEAIRSATLGRRFPEYATLEHFDDRVADRLQVIRAETGREPTQAEIGKARTDEARRARAAVAGYDLVFTPVKSLVLLWALDERPWVRDAVLAIHEQARDSALALLEQHAAYTRSGDVGQAQLATTGLIYAVFDHYDSRNSDPNLHTHVPISNKIRAVDGGWRSLDGRALHRIAVAASEHYNSTVETLAGRYLGLDFTVRPDTMRKRHPVREVLGMPLEFVTTFSSRRGEIEGRYEQLIVDFRRAHGRDPDHQAAFRLAERANLDTRGPKQPPRSLHELRAAWTQRLTAEHGRTALRTLAAVVTATNPDAVTAPQPTMLSADEISTLAALTVGRAEAARSTWTVWNLRAEADRLLREPPVGVFPHGIRFTDSPARTTVLEHVVAEAIDTLCVPVTVEPDLDEPAALRRADGTSVFVQHQATRYTSQEILDAEQRLLEASSATTAAPGPVMTAAVTVHAILDGYEAVHGKTLDPGQRAMVVAFATDPRLIVVGLGPAGAGKTTTMHAYQHVLAAHGRRLIPLATSAAAAAVLAADLVVPAENVHKFVYEHLTHGQPQPGPDDTRPSRKAFFHVRAGDVILIDEAGLAGTRNLDTLRDIADKYRATVRLLGDHRQLSAVESGGALRLLATETGAVELTHLHRFVDAAEADATRRLRDGDTTALDHYQQQNRIVGGSAEAMIEQAYNAWHTDMTAGLRTLMAASTSAGVTALSARARADRVAAAQVEPDGTTLHDGNTAGQGDWVVTRVNDRTKTCNRGRDWVRNGDAWTVTARRRDGSLKVRHLGHGGTLTLPADYVTTNVELLYATTVHRAQGATVDTTHALITDDMTRETLYVAATRARLKTVLYAVTHRILPLDEDRRLDRTVYDPHARAAREVLETVIAREGAQPSATEAITRAHHDARSLATLVPRLRYAAEKADTIRVRTLVAAVLGDDAAGVYRDPAWSAVVRALRAAEADGWDLPQVLAGTARRGPLSAAESPAQLLAWRINDFVDGRIPTPALAQPTSTDAARYAALIGARTTATALEPAQALNPPSALHTDPVTARTNYQTALALFAGDDLAARAAAEVSWPALCAAIRRAEHAGHDPLTVLGTAYLSRPLDTTRTLSDVLATRVTTYLAIIPPPAEPGGVDGWRMLAWTLKAAEQSGQHAELLLAPIRPGTDLDDIRHHLHHYLQPAPARGVLPWLHPTPHVEQADWSSYLTATDTLIQRRTHELTMRAITDRPEWLAGLGDPPVDAHTYPAWLRHVAVVAAYRDQHQVTLDDPTRPLGAYLPAEHAGHTAYLHAADAVLTARHPHSMRLDAPTIRVTADVYLALPDTDRATITTTIAARLGDDWLGPHHGNADTLLTTPTYAAHLHAELVARGHLNPEPVSAPPPLPAVPVLIQQVGSAAPMEHNQPQPGTRITW